MADKQLPTVFIADDHQLVRTGLTYVIEQSGKFEVIGSESVSTSIIQEILSLKPDILILDIGMKMQESSDVTDVMIPDLFQNGFPVSPDRILSHYGGLVILANIKKKQPGLKILVLTQYEDSELLSRIGALGADGIQLKAEMNNVIVSALEQIMTGNSAYSDQVTSIIKQNENNNTSLSPREMEILELIANGFRDKEIADRLEISPRTVAFHKANLKEKLNAESTAELIAFYFKK